MEYTLHTTIITSAWVAVVVASTLESSFIHFRRDRNIVLRIANRADAAEEADFAYKNVSEVVDSCHASGISRKVARLKPLAVIKG